MSAGHTPDAKAFLDRLHGELVSELYRDGPIVAAARQTPSPSPRRRRVLLPSLATLVVAGLLAAAAITASTVTGTAPASAQARVAAAVARTTQEGYRVRAQVSDSRAGRQVSVSDGVFDPVSGAVRMVVVTPEKSKGIVTTHVGDVIYVQTVGHESALSPLERWWMRSTSHPKLADFAGVALQNPRRALDWARSAGDVRDLGRVTGDGWSGRRYAFTLADRLLRVTGTVDVDTGGRVRRLEFTSRSLDTAHLWPGTIHGVLEFRDFGTRERVSIPTKNVWLVRIPERLGPRAG
jgi:hypothetical protein